MTYRHKTLLLLLISLAFFAFAGQSQDNSEEYLKTIEMADAYFTKGDYINAKASYQIAVRLAPEDQYPKDRLQQSLDMIKVQMYQNSLYTQKVQIADDLYDKNDLDAALKVYQEALTIIPDGTHATGRVQEITKTQNDARLNDENYQASITNADQFFREGILDKALEEYRKASSFKPSEAYPKEKAIAVENLLAESSAISGNYESYLQDANIAISRNKYDDAIRLLEAAILLKPDENLPKQKLAEAQELKIAWDSYASIIEEADNYYISKEFELAQEKYLQAKSIKPADEYPKSMLEKIDIALMDISKSNRSSYEVTIALADKLFSEQDYERAMIEYKNALHFKPEEDYAKQRINDINLALSLRKTQEDAYTQAIARADNLFKEERYEEARDEYNRAIGIKSLEQYPKVKVDEIKTILSNLASQREVYNNLIKGADRLFFSDEYVEAREQYRSASAIFPREQYPLDQITMINEILGVRDKYVKAVTNADQLMYDRDYEAALIEFRNAAGINPEEKYPQQKIREIETILAANASIQAGRNRDEIAGEENAITEQEYQEGIAAYQAEKVFEINNDSVAQAALEVVNAQYLDAISSADLAMQSKNYQEALAGYQKAQGLKNGEMYAQRKIDEINGILGEIAAKEALDKKYSDAISGADIALQAKEYDKALAGYQTALGLKDGETYPQEKIEEINGILGGIAVMEALDKQYEDAISGADLAFQAKDYQKALAGYQAALGLKTGESYPQGKIDEINGILGDIAAREALDKQYGDAISGADLAFQAKEYDKALAGYQAALGLKTGESYPQEKIAEINLALAEIVRLEETRQEEIRKQKEIDEQYSLIITRADDFMRNEQFEEARAAYQEALTIKPAEEFPNKQVIEINRNLDALAAQRDQTYQIAISKADNYLDQQDYEMAKLQYDRALELKPEELYPLDKLKLVNEQIMKKRQVIQEEYDKSIADADKFFASKIYDNAIESYRASILLKPEEEYPKEMVRRILKLLTERLIVQINKEPLLISNNTQHKFEFIPVPVKDRKSNYIFFRARNVSKDEYKLIISFGKDQTKNGGIVIKVPAGEDLLEFVVRISAQYKWFSDDNNWITFYPEGGDFEVSLMQISYSD